jgi:hypothetical protein
MRGRAKLAGFLAAALLAAPAPAQQAAEPSTRRPTRRRFPTSAPATTTARSRAASTSAPRCSAAGPAREMLAERRRLDAALAALQPQRRARSTLRRDRLARQRSRVRPRGARGGPGCSPGATPPRAARSPLPGPTGASAACQGLAHLADARARADRRADGSGRGRAGALFDQPRGAGRAGLSRRRFGLRHPVPRQRLGSVLGELGIRRRIVLLSACYSGVFVPFLRAPTRRS